LTLSGRICLEEVRLILGDGVIDGEIVKFPLGHLTRMRTSYLPGAEQSMNQQRYQTGQCRCSRPGYAVERPKASAGVLFGDEAQKLDMVVTKPELVGEIGLRGLKRVGNEPF